MVSKHLLPIAACQWRTFYPRSTLSTLRRLPHRLHPRPHTQPLRPRRFISTTASRYKEPPHHPSGIPASTLYTFAEIQSLSSQPSPKRMLIDVREPSELLSTGTIPSARNIPISSAPDAFFLTPEEFEDKYGFERPGSATEVVFFCKAGVRSKAAARLAGQAGFGGRVGEYAGSWLDWVGNGGEKEVVK